MVFVVELAVKLDAKDVEVVTIARIQTPDKTKSAWLTVMNLLTTKALVLLGFSIMHQLLQHS